MVSSACNSLHLRGVQGQNVLQNIAVSKSKWTEKTQTICGKVILRVARTPPIFTVHSELFFFKIDHYLANGLNYVQGTKSTTFM